MARSSPADAAAAIVRRDPAFRHVVRRHGPPPNRRATRVELRFGDLARAICYQQLAGNAAAAIHGRVLVAVGDPVTALGLLRAGDDVLAGCGVSGPKRRSLLHLAECSLDGTVDLGRLGRLDDDAVCDALTAVRGIGPWTAHMFCLFTLARPDVWPVGDYGVRAGWTQLHGGGEVIGARDLEPLGEAFRPHRSAVAWYCWRAVEDARSSPQPG